tara:strand:+ start:740 stop:1042 length:303 start_codon:yes stop_codon:yes gene_type:complete
MDPTSFDMVAKTKIKFSPSWFKFGGVVIFIGSVLLWLWGGARPGWTMNEIVVWKVDEITGIDYPEAHEAFLPGVEFPALGLFIFFGCVMLELVLKRFLKK